MMTVVMKTPCREQILGLSHTALLSTVCLFCGDEVSRQQYRRSETLPLPHARGSRGFTRVHEDDITLLFCLTRLLNVEPDAGRKVLSENSLLQSVCFDEPFLREESVQEGTRTRFYFILLFIIIYYIQDVVMVHVQLQE